MVAERTEAGRCAVGQGTHVCRYALVATIADRCVTAWTSGDPGQIAALYDDAATFTDSLLRIDAVGPEEVSGMAGARFSQGDFTLEVVEIYAQTNGPDGP